MESGLVLEKDKVIGETIELKGERFVTARYAMGAVMAYWISGCGSDWAL